MIVIVYYTPSTNVERNSNAPYLTQKNGIPPYMVFSDKTLKEMAAVRPQDRAQMLGIGGVGEVKFERYGAPFLTLLEGR